MNSLKHVEENSGCFAVVADEARKLAERTSMATRDIAAIISAILSATEHANESLTAGVRQMHEVVERVREMQGQAETMHESTVQTAVSIHEAAHVSEENSASSEEVTSTSEEMAAQVVQTLAQELPEAARVFRWRYSDDRRPPAIWHR